MEKRKLSRRDFLRLSAAAAAGVIVAACAPATPQVVEVEKVVKETVVVEKEAPAKAGPVEIVMWHQWGGDLPGMSTVLANFDEKIGVDKGIRVRKQFVAAEAGTQASQKFMSSIVGGSPPDCYWFDRFLVPAWAAQNLLVCLDGYADAAGIDRDDFMPILADEASLCGKLYAIGIFTDCCLLHWNKDIFKEVGLDPEQPPTNLAELMEANEKVTKRRPDGSLERMGVYPSYLNYGWAYHWIGTPQKPEGKNFWDFDKNTAACDDPRIVECAEWMQDMAEFYGIDMVDAFREGFGGGETDPFGMGQQAMARKGDWMIQTYDRYFPELDYGVAKVPIPQEYGGESQSSCGGGWCMVIPVGAKHQDAAWEFSAYVGGPEGMETYCRIKHQIPVLKSVAEKEFNYQEPHHVPYMEVLPNLWGRPAIAAGQVMWTEVLGAGDMILHGQDPKEALQEVNKKVNEAMADFDCSQLKA